MRGRGRGRGRERPREEEGFELQVASFSSQSMKKSKARGSRITKSSKSSTSKDGLKARSSRKSRHVKILPKWLAKWEIISDRRPNGKIDKKYIHRVTEVRCRSMKEVERYEKKEIHVGRKRRSLDKERKVRNLEEVELELRLLMALAIYPPNKLRGVHRHFVLLGLMEYLKRCFNRPFSSEEVLQLVDRFYNIEMLKYDGDDEIEMLNHEEEFSLPPEFF